MATNECDCNTCFVIFIVGVSVLVIQVITIIALCIRLVKKHKSRNVATAQSNFVAPRSAGRNNYVDFNIIQRNENDRRINGNQDESIDQMDSLDTNRSENMSDETTN